MSWTSEEITKVLATAYEQLNKPYAIGGVNDQGVYVVRGKPEIADQDPKDFDCSGFSRWVIGQGRGPDGKRIILPHGCMEQVKFCRPLGTERPMPLDLGFADLHPPNNAVDHVVIRYDDVTVIECRGTQKDKDGNDLYGKVVLRPAINWDRQKGFLGWWRVSGIYNVGSPGGY